MSEQRVIDRQHASTGQEEQRGEGERHPHPQGHPERSDATRGRGSAGYGQRTHGITYPVPVTVWITGGSPSLRRSLLIVMRTTLVNGSVNSSQARSRSSSALTTAPSAASRISSTASSFLDRSSRSPRR